MFEDRNAIVHGEHFLINEGAFVEWVVPLCVDIGGSVQFYIPNNEDADAVADARWEVFVVHGDSETSVAQTQDNVQYGQMGYTPFEDQVNGQDRVVESGDVLLVRVTNESPNWYAVVIFNPPSEYMAWIEVIAE